MCVRSAGAALNSRAARTMAAPGNTMAGAQSLESLPPLAAFAAAAGFNSDFLPPLAAGRT